MSPTPEKGEDVPAMAAVSSSKAWISARTYLLGLATLVALSISYYFAIALPKSQRARLEFDRQNYEAAQKEREAEEAKKKADAGFKETMMRVCLSGANDEYWSWVKLNGTEVRGKPGTWSAPTHIWESAAKRKKDAIIECQLRYNLK